MAQRDIKFRAWSDKVGITWDLRSMTPLVTKQPGLFLPDDDGVVLMQFTGIQDKNGNDIYEGDILKGKNGAWAIEWGRIYKRGPMADLGWVLTLKDRTCNLVGIEDMEVVGNIYMNNDLLVDNSVF